MAKQKDTLAGIVVSDAAQARALLKTLQKIDQADKNVKIIDAAFAHKDKKGNISLEQPTDLSGKKSALGGAMISALAGAAILGPVGLVAGGIIGGVLSGVYGKMRDSGVDDGFMKQLAQSLEPGKTALFLLYQGKWEASFDAVKGAMDESGAYLVYTNLPREAEEFARQALEAVPQAEEAIAELEVEEQIAPPEAVEAVEAEVAAPEAAEAAPAEAVEAAAVAEVAAEAAPVVEPAPAPEPAAKPKAAPKKPAKEPPVKPDDFTDIDGIGPKVQAALHKAGIRTYAELEYTPEAKLREVLYKARIVAPKSMATWQTQAGFAARGQWRELYQFNEKNKAK